MAFLLLNNIAKFKNNADTPKIGKVINNNDPNMLGRIKVSIPGIYEPSDAEGSNLPWIGKMQDSFLCSSGMCMFSVPETGSYVEIIWPYDNDNAFYRGLPISKQSGVSVFSEDYPNSWGMTDGKFTLKINSATNTITLTNGSGNITIDAGGNITINGGNITIQGNTTIDGKSFLGHVHSNGNEGANTGGVV